MLPVDENDKPDFDFMENYIKKNVEKVSAANTSKQQEIIEEQSVQLQDVRWAEFPIEDIFNISSGVRLTSKQQIPGDIPFISATMHNNGLSNFISNKNKSLDKNVLGVIYNGNGMVLNFYHPYEAVFSDDVKRWKFKDIEGNKYHYLFIQKLLIKQKKKYMYGYKFNAARMLRQKIMLPVSKDGSPNYEFMEKYMKQVEAKVIKKLKKVNF